MTEEELLRVIEQAAREGWTELYLRDNHRSTLPKEIVQLTSLQTIYLWNNQLSVLPPDARQN